MNSCTVLLPITNPSASLVVSVLCFFHLMNAQNYNLVLAFVVFLGMALNIKDTVVTILFPNDSASHDMSLFGNIGSLVV
jgi:hypothetical protein